ncbi:MAG: ATP phosphoribosyltransferase [Pseudomonadota bacterium]
MTETDNKLILSIPSKGRLKDDTLSIFKKAGFVISKTGDERGYSGVIEGMNGVDVWFSSASEIAYQLKSGKAHIGVTGEDLIQENIYDADTKVNLLQSLNFGHADVVVAVPKCWLDVYKMADLEEMAPQFYREHNRRLRVATKYMMLTRRFFSSHGIVGYRIVESLGATEGSPAAGTAELIVDITSTGSTLEANHLKILDDGVILKSQAHLVASRTATWSQEQLDFKQKLKECMQAQFA